MRIRVYAYVEYDDSRPLEEIATEFAFPNPTVEEPCIMAFVEDWGEIHPQRLYIYDASGACVKTVIREGEPS
jgi:hypothetical protein